MNADGVGAVPLTSNTNADFSPTWSPDGSRIALERIVGANHEIFVINADGSAPANFTNNAAFDGAPSWGR